MFRRIRKTRKKNEKGGAEAPPPLLAMVGPSVFRSIRKTRKKNEKGGAKAPPLLVKLLRPPMPKNTRRRRRRRMGACLPWSSRWNSHNFKCSCSSSKLSRLVALKVMLQGLQEFHLLNIPSSKLSKLTLNRKPKC